MSMRSVRQQGQPWWHRRRRAFGPFHPTESGRAARQGLCPVFPVKTEEKSCIEARSGSEREALARNAMDGISFEDFESSSFDSLYSLQLVRGV